MQLHHLLTRIQGVALVGDPQVEIRGITYDSRQVVPGDLFVALQGEKTDGRLFIGEALDRGAVALASDHTITPEPALPYLRVSDARRFLAEAARELFADPASHLRLIAVTGTNGKTTTSYLIEAIFRRAALRSCVMGTLGMKIGDTHFPTAHTTPEASDLAAYLQQAVSAGCTHGVLEVSSHSLALQRVYGTRFAVGVFSNLTPEHLDFHRDMESYYQAKRLLFAAEGGNRIETAVVNIDDPYGRRLATEWPGPIVRYGFAEAADIRAFDCRTRIDGTELQLITPKCLLDIRSHLAGRPNIYNMMAAAGATLSLGIDPRHIKEGLEALSGVPGRMELVRAGQDYAVVVDYAHTPDALQKLIEIVRPLTLGRIITVFGCGGDRDRMKRPLMGEIATRLSDFAVATSDNPRSEDPLQILAEIEPGMKRGTAPYRIQPDRREAIQEALAKARKNDVVLIAGKGHENYQIVGSRTFPFDDRVVAQALIQLQIQAPGD